MQNLQFPINFLFKITTFANDFTATDAAGKTLAYVRQKKFRLKEQIDIYANESRNHVNYQIKADRWLDFSAAYTFYDAAGDAFGKVARKGWRSIWKARYDIIDANNQTEFSIEEENGWVKVADSVLGDVPILGAMTGYLFNPTYLVKGQKNQEVVRLKKVASFFGRKFKVEKIGPLDDRDAERIMLSLMMMVLLERERG
ncbi:MAG: hypothetical protein WBG71_08075 [Leeuwenhoekiella sp.]